MKITSLVIWVADATLSYKFYKKLGFVIVEVTDRHAVVSCNGFEIQLITMRNEDEFNKDSLATPKGLGLYVYIQVDDVDAKYAEISKLGIQTSSEPRKWDWGAREFAVKDIDGYKLCFYEKVD
jgi:catechol 2,3-dioxygenase-like lactoylglutathione lyase family enzyme